MTIFTTGRKAEGKTIVLYIITPYITYLIIDVKYLCENAFV